MQEGVTTLKLAAVWADNPEMQLSLQALQRSLVRCHAESADKMLTRHAEGERRHVQGVGGKRDSRTQAGRRTCHRCGRHHCIAEEDRRARQPLRNTGKPARRPCCRAALLIWAFQDCFLAYIAGLRSTVDTVAPTEEVASPDTALRSGRKDNAFHLPLTRDMAK